MHTVSAPSAPLFPLPAPLRAALAPAGLARSPRTVAAAPAPAAPPPPASPARCGLHAIRAYRLALLAPALAETPRCTWEAVRALTLTAEAPPDLLAEAARAVFAVGDAAAADWLLRRARRAGSAEAELVAEAMRDHAPADPDLDPVCGTAGQQADAWADRAARAWAARDAAGARAALTRGLALRPHHAELRALGGLIDAELPLPPAFLATVRRGYVSTERWRRRVGFTPTPAPGGDAWSALREDGIVHPRLARPDALARLPATHFVVRLERLIDRAIDAERFGFSAEPAWSALDALGVDIAALRLTA